MTTRSWWALAIALLAQSALGFWRLDLLPMWGDENHTLAMIEALHVGDGALCHRDIHPPVYFLLAKAWTALVPTDPLPAIRALSVLILLAATLVLDRCWLADLPERARRTVLALWVASPAVMLYGRMGRSYSLQILLVLLAAAAAMRWFATISSWRAGVAYCVSCALLLYTHYIPGIAMAVAGTTVLLWRREIRAAAASSAAILLLFSPWLMCLSEATGIVAAKAVYRVAPNFLLDQGVRLAYWFVAFFFGETPPVWALGCGLILAPALVWLLIGARKSPWAPLLAVAAVVGYAGVGQWASFSFVPGRLLWLLPFALIAIGTQVERRWAVALSLLVLSAGSIYSYFLRPGDFLNKGYLVPYQDVMRRIVRESAPQAAIVVMELGGMDIGPFFEPWPGPVLLVHAGPALKMAVTLHPKAPVWHLRTGAFQKDLALANHRVQHYPHLPYSALDRMILARLGRTEAAVFELIRYSSVLE